MEVFQEQPLRYSLIVRELKTYILPNSPTGWGGSLITIQRNPQYYGMVRTFTVPMDFVLDGAWILRTEFYQYGIQGDVQFQIEEFNDVTWQYEVIFIGAIDFSSIKDAGSLEGYKFTCNVLPNDLTSLIKAYENTVFQIPLNVPDALLVQLQGIQLIETAAYNYSSSSDYRSNAFFALTVVTNKINSIYPSTQNSGFVQQNSPDFTTSGQWFMRSTVATSVQIQGNIGVSVNAHAGVARYQINFYKSSTGSTIVQTVFDKVVVGIQDFQFQFNFTVSIGAGESLYCYFLNFDGDSNHGFQMRNGTLNLKYNTISPPSTVRAFRPRYIYDYLINKIYQTQFNGFTYPTQSLLLNSWSQLCITSGDAFRPTLIDYTYFEEGDTLTVGDYLTVINGIGLSGGTVLYNSHTYNVGDTFVVISTALSFTSSGGAIVESGYNPAVIKTSFKDFFQSINSVLNAGFAVQNGIAVLEKKSYFFNPNLIAASVGNVQKFTLEVYTDYIFNTIKCGYPDQTYDVINGRNEVNSEVQYVTALTRIQKEYNIQSAYRADAYGMEFLRIQEGNNNVTNGDNSVFFIYIQPNIVSGQVYYNPEGVEAFLSVTGVDAGYFNMRISPKQNLLRHADYLAGMLYKITGDIKLSSAKKNTGLIVRLLDGTRIGEADNVTISTLGTGLFIPYLANISTKLPTNMLSTITMFPNGRIDFEEDGNMYMGFIINGDVDIAKNSERELKLLLTAQNNMLNLIH